MNDKRKRARDRARKAREELSDGYVRWVLTKGTILKAADIPQSLVELNRERLRAVRAVREIEDGIQAPT